MRLDSATSACSFVVMSTRSEVNWTSATSPLSTISRNSVWVISRMRAWEMVE